MPDNDPISLFNDLPTQVSFPLNPKSRIPHGICWFADKGGNIPDAETVWSEFFHASKEELAFANNERKMETFLLRQKLFGFPFVYAPTGEDTEDGDAVLESGLAKKLPVAICYTRSSRSRQNCLLLDVSRKMG